MMPVDFSVKNVPDRVAKALRARAKRHHRSLQGELLALLTEAASATTGALADPEHSQPAAVREAAEPWGEETVRAKSGEFGHPVSAPAVPVPLGQISDFCRRWKIRELALFGSVLRDDFRPDSDIDVLVRFEPDDPWSLFDLGDMQAELSSIFGRKVDLVERAAVEQSRNWIRRRHILENHRVIYAA